MAKTPIQTQDIDQSLAERLDNVVESSYISVPNTTITNRAKIRDLANDLKPRLGVERLRFHDITTCPLESGPAGEPVYKPINDLFDRVRFYGPAEAIANANGTGIQFNASEGAVEVTFYGTGINLLEQTWNPAGWDTYDIFVDGVLSTSLTNPSGRSAALNSRNYAADIVINLVSGLSLGIHTVRLETSQLACYGFEILNETATLTTTPGAAYNGADRRESLIDSQSYNSGFALTEGTPGTKGGHVSVYQDADGAIKKAVRYTEATQLNLGAVDHSNEEIIRSYNWHEFNAGRSDDFSSVVSTPQIDAAFTLDDGTTSLVGQTIRSTDGIHLLQTAAGDFYTFTFVGTGLDVTSETTTGTCEIFIDGNSVGNFADLSTGIIPVVSGLPYGTHTVKFSRTNAADFSTIKDFLVYGPKKPTLPADAVELGDYFLMADFIDASVEGVDTIGTGVLRKTAQREVIYDGAWSFSGYPNIAHPVGVDLRTSTATDSMKYYFYGTGITLKFDTGGAADFTIDIDGTSDFSGVTTNLLSSGNSFNASTGTFTGNAVSGDSVSISGLSLGFHTITVTNNASTFVISALDIITPIHTPSFDSEIAKQQIVGASGGGIRDQRKLVGKPTLKTRTQQIEDGEIQFDSDFSGFKFFNTTAGFSLVRAVSTPYKNSSGDWRWKFNIVFDHTSGTSINNDVVGLTFKSLTSYNQGFTVCGGGDTTNGRGFVVQNTGTLDVGYQNVSSLSRISGDVELEGKPTWAV